MTEYRTLGEFCDATWGAEHDQAIEATLQWVVAEISKHADRREQDLGNSAPGLHFSADGMRVMITDIANRIRQHRQLAADDR